MAKVKSSKKRFTELTTPTTTSRVLTWLLLLLLPLIGFLLGMRYQESKDTLRMFDMQEKMIEQKYNTPSPVAE